ncbi:hypothetical protein A2U01_0016949 [Trifolium medium]|uniref:Uncharacterized protein n=1 Tax=Trifolium medium TaxID=97028 RepID=A0A392N861_9FABA|nr:hypothetical protein [Trifolium medium]
MRCHNLHCVDGDGVVDIIIWLITYISPGFSAICGLTFPAPLAKAPADLSLSSTGLPMWRSLFWCSLEGLSDQGSEAMQQIISTLATITSGLRIEGYVNLGLLAENCANAGALDFRITVPPI